MGNIMKRKCAAAILGLVLGISMLSGCSGKDASVSDDKESADDVLLGEVSAIGDNSITVKLGTMKEREQGQKAETEEPDENSQQEDSSERETQSGEQPADNQQEGEHPSMLELTGEQQEIKITEETSIKRQGMSGRSGGKLGEAPDGEETESENAEGEAPNGEKPDSGNIDGEKPNGEKPDSENTEGEAPNGEKPDSGNIDGEKPNGEKPDGEKPDGAPSQEQEAEEITLEEISEGDTVSITFDEDGNASEITVMSFGGGMGQPDGMAQSGGVDSYTAVTEYTSDTEVEGESFTSTGTDENAVHVLDGASVSFNDVTVSRESSDSTGGDNSSFYGVGAAILTTDGTSYISDSLIETDSAGAAGIFAYDNGTVYAADTDIYTKQDTSGGIHAAGGGTLYAWDLDVETDGESSAAVRSDRGGGKMVVDGGSYISNGTGSPAVYSTADIAINDAELTANGSEAICIEGHNSIHLYDSDLKGNMSDDSQNDCAWNVILYQSMSGDSEIGNSTFEMNGGTLKAENGGMFYTTNTESTITLSGVNITYAEDSEFFLRCTGNKNQRGWGQSGENGADCLFTAVKQDMEGDIIWDSISSLDFYMADGSTLKGAVIDDEACAGENGEGYCNLYIGEDCTWTVTGDSVLTRLSCAGTILDENGKTVTVKGSDGSIYVEGDSSYTITVDTYEDTADLSGASDTTTWEDYQVEKPAELE